MKRNYIIIFLCCMTIHCLQKNTMAHEQNNVLGQNLNTQNATTKDEDGVEIQFLKEMMTYKNLSTMGTEMAIQMMATQGASMANAYITSQAQLLSTKIDRDSQTIQTSMQSFQKQAQMDQQKNLQNMITAFSQAQKNVQNQTTQALAVSNLELDYLYKNISLDQPQKNYVFNQIQFDQLFTLGTMLTPAGALWKNPFSVGDWQYEKETNSFWQYQSSPIFNTMLDDDGKSGALSSQQAENNAIFAEYFTDLPEYTIAGTITIYRADFPCFVGILCNKSRWISGNFESLRKSRMVGIYAESAQDIGVYFAEQFTMNETQLKAHPNDDPIQTPLQQIINKKNDKKISIPHEIFANIKHQPLKINFKISNAATSATCTFSFQDKEPMTLSVKNLDTHLFMYHGIGFISPGAIAEYVITQPEDFIFTTKDISNFKD